jgi:hypothetical protein
MSETFQSNAAGDPTPLARFYLVGGADYRQEWHFEEIDAQGDVTGDRNFSQWEGRWAFRIGASPTATALVTSTDIAANGSGSTGRLIISFSDVETALLQANGGTTTHSEWWGVLVGDDPDGDTKTLAHAKVILTHVPQP